MALIKMKCNLIVSSYVQQSCIEYSVLFNTDFVKFAQFCFFDILTKSLSIGHKEAFRWNFDILLRNHFNSSDAQFFPFLPSALSFA